MKLASFFLTLVLLYFPTLIYAQILDDSTKRVYGPKTTLVFKESDVLEGFEKKQFIDTSLNAFHQFNHVNRSQNFYQDLGNWGTAMRPIFYQMPNQIGTILGINAYQPYLFTPENVRYFDTKSPYTHASYVQGARGDQSIDFIYSQNINKNWNVGANYIRLNSNKQYGASNGNTREVMADHIGVVFFTSYLSKNKKYHLLYHYAHLNQVVHETGGVLLNAALPENGIYSFRDASANLGSTAQSWQTQNNHRVYQQFAFFKGFTLFHNLDVKRQRDRFDDTDSKSHLKFYPPAQVAKGDTIYNLNAKATSEGTIFRLYENKFGIKGIFGKFDYQAYFKNRIFTWNSELEGQTLKVYDKDSNLVSSDAIPKKLITGFENFVGGKISYLITDSIRFTSEAELQLGTNYLINNRLESKFFRASFKSALSSPTLFQRRFVSNHFNWDNKYSNVVANELSGEIILRLKNLLFNPFGSYTLINNYIYFDQTAQAKQSNKSIQLAKIGLNLNYNLGKIHTASTVIYTGRLGEDLIRIPTWFANSRIYCNDCVFKKILKSQFGVEMHYKSDYYADAYMPVTKQFYLQNDFLVKSYLVADVFANFQIDTFRLFLKFAHVNQLPESGYITTPIYPGMRRTFTFGIFWQFYN